MFHRRFQEEQAIGRPVSSGLSVAGIIISIFGLLVQLLFVFFVLSAAFGWLAVINERLDKWHLRYITELRHELEQQAASGELSANTDTLRGLVYPLFSAQRPADQRRCSGA